MLGSDPPPPPGTAGRAAPAQTPLPARRPRRGRGGGRANELPCHSPPPPRKAIFFPPWHPVPSSSGRVHLRDDPSFAPPLWKLAAQWRLTGPATTGRRSGQNMSFVRGSVAPSPILVTPAYVCQNQQWDVAVTLRHPNPPFGKDPRAKPPPPPCPCQVNSKCCFHNFCKQALFSGGP